MGTVLDSGTLSGAANAAALGTLIAEKIRDNLSAHVAWELVEEYNPGGTARFYVFKCLSSVNGLENDFYMVMCRDVAGASPGRLQFHLAEGYDAVTHTISLMCAKEASQGTMTNYAYDSKGRQTTKTFALTNAVFTGNAGTPNYFTCTPSGTSVNYQMIIYDDGFVWIPYGATTGWYYCGTYDYVGLPSLVLPLHQMGSTSTMSSPSSITRNPLCISGNFHHWARTTDSPASPGGANLLGTNAGDPDWKDALQDQKAHVMDILITINSVQTPPGNANATDVIGYLIGKTKRCRYLGGQGSTYSFGDAYEMEGSLWVPHQYTSGNAHIFDTGVTP